ncbi:MAG TPA: DNA polymerase III subunit delta [Candidatus Microsaccharimonas sp.]|nr:DNA polymerase III subunit delta [Candidatus Microsaccharimonas sp.]
MLITLAGENSFGLEVELQKITAAFLAAHDEFGVERLDGEEVEFGRLQEALTSLPFLADKKLIVLRRPSANKQFTEQAEELLTGVPETTDVVIIEPKLDKRLAYYKLLKKSTDFREFKELDVAGLVRWLVAEATVKQGKITLADASYLVQRVGTNQQLLANELEKLLLHSNTITRQSIDLLTEATPQSTIFELLEAAFAGNRKRTLQLYSEQRALKVEPPQIVAMLAWQLHIVALIKAAKDRSVDQIAGEAKLSPFVVKKSQSIARRLTLAELRALIQDLLAIDVRSKSKGLDADEALQNYLLQLASAQ